ncbi:hypothetical protein [Leptospira alexanderi]|uniref:Uncharacterized protein n=1 Tax=Leptospira alexanderi serovar Manhao 3 str. L 60 TaxID=1049759 RepID=V6HXL4_9LEPT|nr:hypothetical protein [Leptospira alexanderi]EQA62251.1 hypothetical protein LEP1GSC062_0088 [Leptospira alexanderi serovar Manhao 3 str. L 60]
MNSNAYEDPVRDRSFVLKNFDSYVDEIATKLKFLAETREKIKDDILYYADTSYSIERLYSLMKDIENALEFNQIRSMQYSYSVSVKGSLDEIFLPVGNASTILSSLQRTLKVFDKKAKLNLVNVLRGSTILCFDYSKEAYSNEKFDREGISKQFKVLYESLNEPKEKLVRTLNKVFQGDEKKRDGAVRAFKGLTPVPGSETIIRILPEFNESEPIEVHSEMREAINFIVPTSQKKDIRVDWENRIAKGFVREINNVSKSFILYEEQDSDDETGSLIKIHYDSNTFEEKILSLFRKKATIHFEKEGNKNRYHVDRISK